MKTVIRIIIYITLIIITTTLGIIGYINKPLSHPSEQILNIDYYKYNTQTGNYDEITIKENKINYSGESLELNECKKYKFTETTNILKLDCNKAFRIVGFTEEALVINMNDENHYFYKEQEKSYNGEFQRKYKMSISAYKLQGEKEIEEKEITMERFNELIKQNTLSYVYIKGSNCKDECTFFNKQFSNFSTKNNIYYLNSNKIKQSDIDKLNKNYKDFPLNISEYNYDKPVVYIIGNKKLIKILNINGTGFDYSKYNNFIYSFVTIIF